MGENKLPLVSIVMTSYNRGHYIGQAIESVLSQECSFPIEIIIGDDFSTDNSRSILLGYRERYPNTVILNFQEHNQGFGRNWASTCKMARGKYIAFLDDDDYYCDNHRLQKMVDFFEHNPDYGLIHTNFFFYDIMNDHLWPSDKNHMVEDGDLTNAIFEGRESLCFGTSMIRKKLLDKYVPLDEYIRLDFPIQDWPTEVLLAPRCKFMYLNEPSYVYRQYWGSMSKPMEYNQIIEKYSKEKIMYAKICEWVNIPFDEMGYDSYVNSLLMGLAYQKGDYKIAQRYAALCDTSLKKLCTKTWMSFQLFRIAKKIRHSVTMN